MNVLKFLLLSISLLLFSCTNGNEEELNSISILPQNSFVVDCGYADIEIVISATSKWEIVPSADWVTPSFFSGNGDGKVVLHVEENTTMDEREGSIEVKCGKQHVVVSIHQYGKIDSPYIDLNLESSNVHTIFDSYTGVVSIQYPEKVSYDISEGDAIVLPSKYLYAIRIIKSSEVKGKSIILNTEEGNMSDLFKNVSFTLSTGNNTKSRSMTRSVNPISSGYLDDDGEYIELENYSPITSVNLISNEVSYDGTILKEGRFGTLSLDRCNISTTLDGVFSFDFGKRTLSSKHSIGDLKNFSCNLTGTLSFELLIKYLIDKQFKDTKDGIIKENIIRPLVLKFVVGGVPVVILVYVHLGESSMLDFDSSFSISSGFTASTSLSVGIDWNKEKGITSSHSVTNELDLIKPSFSLIGNVTSKVSLYPRIEIGIYNLLGPWITPRPYLKNTIDASVHGSFNGVEAMSWRSKLFAGVDLQMGLYFDFGMFDKELWKSNIINCVSDKLLFDAPNRITTVYPEDVISIESGSNVNAKFLVESYSPITKEYYPCPLALVKFSGDGAIGSTIKVADKEGNVTARWEPSLEASFVSRSSSTCTLNADVLDHNQNVIHVANAKVKIQKQDSDDTQPKAVDLGLSVKWASMNIGANNIGDPGLYFAWGETSQKSKSTPYDMEHYAFGKFIKFDDDYGEWHCKSIGSSIIGTNRDAAHALWGGEWRMPTNKEVKELIEKCVFEPGYENGIRGRWAIGPNGNRIFLPSGGFANSTISELSMYDDRGWYWSGELSNHNYPYSGGTCKHCDHFAGSFFVTTGNSSLGEEYGKSDRSHGYNIRAVCP